MKFKITIVCLMASLSSFSQIDDMGSAVTEKSLFNVQVGAVGIWGSHEARLGNRFALRTEVGFDLWVYDTWYTEPSYAMVPSISVEPRWYYNLNKRSVKGRKTSKNSGNFVTIATEYYPNLFVIGNLPDHIHVPNQISIIPKWGIRRHIGSTNINYELGIGIGYFTYLGEDDKRYYSNTEGATLDLHLRIGYTF
ncbi:hypothetical protein [Flavobacterium coralii]|uniref:hypothetical protein n=2 Tax=Flavobacterium coralii TaxID=2838017 RepID=UPI000C4A901E|nr:hypothetical protein [Flavobacterium sp.]|tara:strand:- start:17831 stop:18412 length:582 start_codon:yes stop_codon:yes gene_type:complete